MENLPVQLTEKPKYINDGQKALLKLICEKFESGEPLEKSEAMTIYKDKVQRHTQTWTNCKYFDHDKKKWIPGYENYREWEIDNLCTSWLLRALGSLIQKGYLTVIPKINLSNLSLKE